jgi:prepilin signal peptidase PulO-like enzyme (type II secretory pathway)
MESILYFFLVVLGLLVGSFLNVVILRFNTGASLAKGRSKCFSCAKTLSWYELLPLVSFIMLRGKCGTCGTKISWQYPMVEFSTALLFVLAFKSMNDFTFNAYENILFALSLAILALYVVICVYDLRHKIIPDLFSFSAAGVALAFMGVTWLSNHYIDLSQIIAGPMLFLFFYFFWFVSKGTWMGLGDAKLALSIGWFLGLGQGLVAILFAFWIGAIVSVILIGLQKAGLMGGKLGMKSEIPFGPYILIGFLLVFVFHTDIEGLLSFLAV